MLKVLVELLLLSLAVVFTEKEGATTFVSLHLDREDFLDGKIAVEVNLMTGKELAVERIRIVPQAE